MIRHDSHDLTDHCMCRAIALFGVNARRLIPCLPTPRTFGSTLSRGHKVGWCVCVCEYVRRGIASAGRGRSAGGRRAGAGIVPRSVGGRLASVRGGQARSRMGWRGALGRSVAPPSASIYTRRAPRHHRVCLCSSPPSCPSMWSSPAHHRSRPRASRAREPRRLTNRRGRSITSHLSVAGVGERIAGARRLRMLGESLHGGRSALARRQRPKLMQLAATSPSLRGYMHRAREAPESPLEATPAATLMARRHLPCPDALEKDSVIEGAFRLLAVSRRRFASMGTFRRPPDPTSVVCCAPLGTCCGGGGRVLHPSAHPPPLLCSPPAPSRHCHIPPRLPPSPRSGS